MTRKIRRSLPVLWWYLYLTLTLLTWTIWRAPTNASKCRMGFNSAFKGLTLILLTWTIWRAPTNASKWRMGFNLAFKGLKTCVTPFFKTVTMATWRSRGPQCVLHWLPRVTWQDIPCHSEAGSAPILQFRCAAAKTVISFGVKTGFDPRKALRLPPYAQSARLWVHPASCSEGIFSWALQNQPLIPSHTEGQIEWGQSPCWADGIALT